jgi:hypothetical protein
MLDDYCQGFDEPTRNNVEISIKATKNMPAWYNFFNPKYISTQFTGLTRFHD